MEDYEEDGRSSISQCITLLCIGGGLLWVSINIFNANKLEVKYFFLGLILYIKNFFSVIFMGEKEYIGKLECSWWTVIFCVTVYFTLYCFFSALSKLDDLKK